LPHRSFLFTQAPRWKNRHFEIPHGLPSQLSSWLLETGSLTQRLRAKYGSGFAVQLLFQGWQPAYIDECQLLSCSSARRYHLLREVILTYNQQALVLARTVLPAQTLNIAQRKLANLGNRPLGEVLFAYPDLKLGQRQFSLAEPRVWSNDLRALCNIEQAIWGRRTVYAIHQQPLLVAEFFLPSLFIAHKNPLI
jgi:chorismate--pyruvate lyase